MSGSHLILAHGVGKVFQSPIPVWLYGAGAGATVLVSFVIRALAGGERPLPSPRPVAGPRAARAIRVIFKSVALVGFGLAIVAAVVTRQEGFTLTTLLFWLGLIVGVTVVSAVLAGAWEAADPWATTEDFYRLESTKVTAHEPPWWLGPLLVYMLFWFELVSGVGFKDFGVLAVLIGYSIYAFTFRSYFGGGWSEADPLSILFGFAGRSAPLSLRADGIFYTGPIAGLDEPGPMPVSLFLSVFVLLGSTTLDNIRETVGWTVFKQNLGIDTISTTIVDSIALLVFGALFFLPFAIAVVVSHRWLARDLRAIDVARRFGWSLIPIGVAYVLAHNASLVISGLPQLIRLLSDPFERGWNLLGTAHAFPGYSPSPLLVWVIEIVLIVGGHILGVLSAHRAAIRLSSDRRSAVKSQYALTVLMTLFTTTTLLLLAQPLVV